MQDVPAAGPLLFPLPGYVVADAMIGYARDDYRLTLNVNNLANRSFTYPSIASSQIVVGEGRNVLLSARKAF